MAVVGLAALHAHERCTERHQTVQNCGRWFKRLRQVVVKKGARLHAGHCRLVSALSELLCEPSIVVLKGWARPTVCCPVGACRILGGCCCCDLCMHLVRKQGSSNLTVVDDVRLWNLMCVQRVYNW